MNFLWWFLSMVAIASCIIPVRLAITFYQTPRPQFILVLGGNADRVYAAAELAKTHPLDILVSDYPNTYETNKDIFRRMSTPSDRVHYDFCPTDTVTNFTCTVDYFSRKNIQHVFLVTSDYHMERAKSIAYIVFGSRGILVSPFVVPSTQGSSHESWWRIFRDTFRSLLWVVSGKTGASFNPRLMAQERK